MKKNIYIFIIELQEINAVAVVDVVAAFAGDVLNVAVVLVVTKAELEK